MKMLFLLAACTAVPVGIVVLARTPGECEPYAEVCRHCSDCSRCRHCHVEGGICSVCKDKPERR